MRASAVGLALNPASTTPLGDKGFRQLLDQYVSVGCTYYGLGADWGVLQPSVATIDLEPLLYPLRTIVGSYPQLDTFGLTLTMINTARISRPAELTNRPWDDPDVIRTFCGLIDRLTMEPTLAQRVSYVLLGNEIEASLGAPADLEAFVKFYAAVVAHVHTRLPLVKVGTIISAPVALVGGRDFFDRFLALSDLAAYTFYPVKGMFTATPITGSWQVETEAQFSAELTALMARSGDTPYLINEFGVSASSVSGSSEKKQSDFVARAFSIMGAKRPVALVWHAQHDYDPSFAESFSPPVRSYVENVGLRTWNADRPKRAWSTFGTWARSWRG